MRPLLPFCLATVLALSGCGVSGPARLTALQGAALPPQVALDLAAEPGSETARFRLSLQAELAAKGIQAAPDAPYRLVVTLARSDASLGLTQDKGGEGRPVDWKSGPRRHHWYHRCEAQRIRAGATGIDGAGTPPLSASAEMDLCKVNDADIDQLAADLVSSLTPRTAPQG